MNFNSYKAVLPCLGNAIYTSGSKQTSPSLHHMKYAVGQGHVQVLSLAVKSVQLIYVALDWGILLTTPGEPVSTCSNAHPKCFREPSPFHILWWGCFWHFIPTTHYQRSVINRAGMHRIIPYFNEKLLKQTKLLEMLCFSPDQCLLSSLLTAVVYFQSHTCFHDTVCKETSLTCHNQQMNWHVAKHWRANTTKTSCCWLWGWQRGWTKQWARPAWQGETCQLHAGKIYMFWGSNSKINKPSLQTCWCYIIATLIQLQTGTQHCIRSTKLLCK